MEVYELIQKSHGKLILQYSIAVFTYSEYRKSKSITNKIIETYIGMTELVSRSVPVVTV